MARTVCMAAAFMLASAVEQANLCSSGGGSCPSGDESQNVVALLQLQMDVVKDGVDAAARQMTRTQQQISQPTRPDMACACCADRHGSTSCSWKEEYNNTGAPVVGEACRAEFGPFCDEEACDDTVSESAGTWMVCHPVSKSAPNVQQNRVGAL